MLNCIFWITAVVTTAVIWLCNTALNPLWLLLILPTSYLGIVLLYWIFWIVGLRLFLSKKKKRTSPSRLAAATIRITLRWMCSLFRLHLSLTGEEKIPNEPCVFVCNHMSNIDPLALIALLKKRDLVYIAKKETRKIPLAGAYMNSACFLFIDRKNPRLAVQTLQDAGEEMKTLGVDVGIFPEGTRSKNGKLLRFKEGGFVLAKQAEVPIVVMAIKGTEKVKRRFPWASTKVSAQILDVFDRDTVLSTDPKDLTLRAREIIAKELGQ